MARNVGILHGQWDYCILNWGMTGERREKRRGRGGLGSPWLFFSNLNDGHSGRY